MRILVVQESDWVGVGPHQSHHLIERLSVKGHEIRVVDHRLRWRESGKGVINRGEIRSGYHKVIEDARVDIITPGFVGLPVLVYFSLLISHRREIKKQIIDLKPDVIVGFGILNASIALDIAKDYEIPFLYYIIDELHRLVPEGTIQSIAKKVESRNLQRADYILTINEGLREYCISLGAPPSRIEVLRAGVDLKRFEKGDRENIREHYGIQDSETVLFFMGWLYNFSGIDAVAKELTRHNRHSMRLLVIGRGELWDTLQEIKSRGEFGDKLILEDWKPYEEIARYISASDVCILPAKANEIMRNIVPIKMYEYMAAGKPVIATRLHGLELEFGSDNGVIFIENSREVMNKTQEMVGVGKVQEEGLKAKNFVKNMDWDTTTTKFEDILSTVIEDKRSVGMKQMAPIGLETR